MRQGNVFPLGTVSDGFGIFDCGVGVLVADLEHQEVLQTPLDCGAGVKPCCPWMVLPAAGREGQRGGSVPKQAGECPSRVVFPGAGAPLLAGVFPGTGTRKIPAGFPRCSQEGDEG